MDDSAIQGLLGGFAALFTGAFLLVIFSVLIIMIVSLWKVFTKAGQPGWAAIVPIYNAIVLLQIIGRPLWWILLFMIPAVNIVFGIICYVDLAKSFGKGAGFACGLMFLGFIFFPILAFGDARYLGPAAATTAPALGAAS